MNSRPAEDLAEDVAAAVGGDRGALERVIRAVQPLVARLALRFFACPAHAEDATQEVLVQLVTKLDRFERQSAFTTWVYRVATNKFLSLARSPAEREALSLEAFDEELTQVTDHAVEPVAHLDDDILAAEVRIGCTLAMLLCLDRPTRLAYILGDIAELDHRTAADILGCSNAAYRKRLERARGTITDLMRRRCGVFDDRNACRCEARIPIAVDKQRLDPKRLVLATSAEQVRRFPEILDRIRRLEEVRRTAAIYQSHPDPSARVDFAGLLRQMLGSDQG